MPIAIIHRPAVEPVTLAEAKAHCRIDGTADDTVVASLITTSRLQIEAALGLALISQTWRMTRDTWPASGSIRLSVRPVLAIAAIRVAEGSGGHINVDPALWKLERGDDGRGAIVLTRGMSWPQPKPRNDGIQIDIEAGYGVSPGDVPAPIRHALLLLVAHWYENRDPTSAATPTRAPPEAISVLLSPYRRVAL